MQSCPNCGKKLIQSSKGQKCIYCNYCNIPTEKLKFETLNNKDYRVYQPIISWFNGF